MYINISLVLCILLQLTYCAEKPGPSDGKAGGGGGGKGGKGGKKGKGKEDVITKPTRLRKAFVSRTTTPHPASISLFRYEHLVALNATTTTTEWHEVKRIKERIQAKDPRDIVIIDVLRTKYNLMVEKHRHKLEFNRFKRYVLKTGSNGTRFLKQFLQVADEFKAFEEKVRQIDALLKIWGLPKYVHIHNRFSYNTKPITPPLNYTPTEYYSKWMYFKSSVIDVRYKEWYHDKMSNPVRWEDMNIHTTAWWHVAAQNLPGFRHHPRKFNLPAKKQRRLNSTILYYRKLAEMKRLNITGSPNDYNGTLLPTTTIAINYEQPDVFEAINKYFNACSIGERSNSNPWWGPMEN